jgi:hypothetical protein
MRKVVVSVAAAAAGFRIHPNPTRGRITISATAPSNTPEPIRIHDAVGRIVRTIVGSGTATWDARDASGTPVPAGVYFVTRGLPGNLATEKVVVLR